VYASIFWSFFLYWLDLQWTGCSSESLFCSWRERVCKAYVRRRRWCVNGRVLMMCSMWFTVWFCEWQGADEEVAKVTVIGRLCCPFVSAEVVNVFDGTLSVMFSDAMCLHALQWPVLPNSIQCSLAIQNLTGSNLPVRFQVTALGKLLTRMCLCHQAV